MGQRCQYRYTPSLAVDLETDPTGREMRPRFRHQRSIKEGWPSRSRAPYAASILTVTKRRTRFLFLVFCILLCPGARSAWVADTLPDRLSDREFWNLILSLSEPAGTFSSENVLSNESGFAFAISDLLRKTESDGVYLGVGPEQNFNYLAAIRPRMAFIIDIRRQNLLQHLLYKALIELSSDRAEFVSRLFSRTRPKGLSSAATARDLFRAFAVAPVDEPAFQANLRRVKILLTSDHKFSLTPEDITAIEHLYTAFRDFGPQLDYNSTGKMPGGRSDAMPTYAELMTETGENAREYSYLSNEKSYEFIRMMESRNLLVPIVGDFGGPKAIRAIGKYLKDHRASVSVFYVSNVESYLFRSAPGPNPNGGAVNFYNNVRALPLTASSTFLRSIPLPSGRGGATAWQSLVTASVQQTIEDLDSGRLKTYLDLFLRPEANGVRREAVPIR